MEPQLVHHRWSPAEITHLATIILVPTEAATVADAASPRGRRTHRRPVEVGA